MQSIRSEQALNIPNMLTILRITLLPAIVWRYRLGDLLGALLVYLAAMLTDFLDGVIARRMDQVTALGKLLDPLADKLSLVVLLMLFALDGQISLRLVQIVLLKETILILGSLAALRFGFVVSALPIGKITTLSFVASTVCRLLLLRLAADVLLWLYVLLSFAALVCYSVVLMIRFRAERTVL